jgi:hypothetical protein
MTEKAEMKKELVGVAKTIRESGLFNYQEGKNLANVLNYIAGTYSEHYAARDDMQTIDIWEARGSLMDTSIDTAIKYLMRFGKKGGSNEKDLMKAIHYVLLALYAKQAGEDMSLSNLGKNSAEASKSKDMRDVLESLPRGKILTADNTTKIGENVDEHG